jgi:hypothetical protein
VSEEYEYAITSAIVQMVNVEEVDGAGGLERDVGPPVRGYGECPGEALPQNLKKPYYY